jgi:N-acetyl sugar amidotransferase
MTNSLFGLPEVVKFCEKCVISNQRPASTVEMLSDGTRKVGINISNGICDACRFNEIKQNEINWDQRSSQLYDMLSVYRRNDGTHDVLVPSSGGKDSSYTAYLLKHKYDMNPLCITWAPNMFTEVGRSNLESLTIMGGLDSILYTPNGKLHRYLTKLAFKNLCHPFQPFIHGQKVIGPKLASKFGINLVVYGENQAEYGNPVDDNENPFMDFEFFSSEEPKKMKFGGKSVKEILNQTDFTYNDFSSYIPLSKNEVSSNSIKMTYLGYFEKWDPQSIYYYVSDNTGFKPATERSEGTYSRYTEIDDKIVPFHFYTTFIKFGIGRATYDACQEIRNGHIDRNEAVALVRKYDGEFPKKWLPDFLSYLDITEDDFNQIIDSNRSPHLWQKSENNFKLKYQVK